ncbi:DUF1823 family protein [Lyngbya confervoides]|uniref:DUF1823 family protein n=1 Tax=Lyngbya confervoides BDU141951 TaxID=1574623 RepID=A0ABD4T4F1_9CYAN|nr:DUF1823 family protein [Lyngbya confervoides]MCM1983325.1 DUF1823 family protein [Lyngbya confervoides BDU141951]
MTSSDSSLEVLPLTQQTLWQILEDQVSDLAVNQLLWQSLGYQHQDGQWDISHVEAYWAEKFPTPPDFIGSRPATVHLTRSIPQENKQLLKTYLGFKGYTVDQLQPRLTRRATAVSWLLSYMKAQGMLA